MMIRMKQGLAVAASLIILIAVYVASSAEQVQAGARRGTMATTSAPYWTPVPPPSCGNGQPASPRKTEFVVLIWNKLHEVYQIETVFDVACKAEARVFELRNAGENSYCVIVSTPPKK